MRRFVCAAVLTVLVAGSLAACTSEPAPTDVAVSWSDSSRRMIRVTWKESGTQPNKISVEGVAAAPPDIVQYVDGSAPNTALLPAAEFPADGTFRVSVVLGSLSGGITSKPGLSPMFDTDGPARPVLTSVQLPRSGGIQVGWRPGVPQEDFTPGDPLDVTKPSTAFVPVVTRAGRQQVTALSGAATSNRHLIKGIRPPFLFNVRASNEWGATYGGSVVADTTSTAAAFPTRTVFSLATPIRGRVTRHRLVCRSGSCSPEEIPGPGLAVVLQARSSASQAWAAVATTTTRAGGTYYFAPRSPGTRQYRVLAATSTGTWTAFGSGSAAGTTGSRVRVWFKFSVPTPRYRQKVTASVRIWPARSVTATLQRWNGRAWVSVKYVALRNGSGSYAFTAVMKGSYGYRVVVPTVSYAGKPVLGYGTPSTVLTTR